MSDRAAGLPADAATAAEIGYLRACLDAAASSPESFDLKVLLPRLSKVLAGWDAIAADAARQERQRIRAYVTERIRELQAMGWSGQGETVPQSELRMVLGLLEDAL